MSVYFITGASRGFGAEIVDKALAKGHQVVATARDTEPIEERFGIRGDLVPVDVDVNDAAQVEDAVRVALSRSPTHLIRRYASSSAPTRTRVSPTSSRRYTRNSSGGVTSRPPPISWTRKSQARRVTNPNVIHPADGAVPRQDHVLPGWR